MNVDRIITNARIYTVDPTQPWAEAAAITDGKFAAIGSTADIEALATPTTARENMHGHMVLPGIVDVHNHHTRGGQAALYETNILPTLSFDGILAAVAAAAAKAAPGEWIVGGIWGSNHVARLSTLAARHELDAAAAGHPVMLRDDSLHNRWVNAAALAIIGIGPTTPNPPEGEIVRDPATGEAVGLLLEKACALAEQTVIKTIPDYPARMDASTTHAIRMLNSYGITGFQDANTMLPFLEALKRVDATGGLTAWCVASMPALDTTFGVAVHGDALFALRETYRTPHIRPDFVKLFMDGVPTTRTAAMLDPYIATALNGCCFRGDALISIPDLVRWLAKCERLGLSAKIHCTGDAAVRDTLDAIDIVRSFNGPRPETTAPQHQIAHASFIAPSDIPRFHALGVTADLSPIIWYPGPINAAIAAVIPADRARHYWPNKDLHQSGALLAAGSDWPVMPTPDPWLGIEGMITRRNPDGTTPGALWPEQALDLATVLPIYTANAARACGLGAIAGTISPGKSADFIVLDRNLFDIPATDIAKTKVLSTWFEGKQVHER